MSEQDIPIESEPRTRWSEVSGGIGAATAYQRHFDELAAQGLDIHGEAALIEKLVSPPARILDAGCGTGRVATQLTSLGYHCVGVDADRQMIAVAERRDPATLWVLQDLSRLELRSQAFDLAVLAGNVVPLLAPGTLDATMQRVPPTSSRVASSSRASGWTRPTFPGGPGHAGGGLRPRLHVAGLSFLRRYSVGPAAVARGHRMSWHPIVA